VRLDALAQDWPRVVAFGRARHDWLATFPELPNGIPSRSTSERVFAALSPAGLGRCLTRWLHSCAGLLGVEHLAIDGKALRGSGCAGEGLGMLHRVSAWATQAQLSLGQVAVEGKSNELAALPELLALLNLKGVLVSLDAIGCQKAIARQIVEGGGDYVLTVKDNQPNLARDILASIAAAHGRTEKRSCTVLYNLGGIADRAAWEKLTVIGMCYSERTVGDQTSHELRLFIGSRRAGVEAYARAYRGHWGIEGGCHWALDVVFRFDQCRRRHGHAAENLPSLRKMVLSLLNQERGKASNRTAQHSRAARRVSKQHITSCGSLKTKGA
jgi:predicted transposase YbfD/YdcC